MKGQRAKGILNELEHKGEADLELELEK